MSIFRSSRRDLLRNAAGPALFLLTRSSAFAASDFWNKKPSTDWSVDEVELLKSKSPWAKKVRAEIAGGGGARGGGGGSMDSAGSPGTFGGMSGADSNGIGGGGGSRGGGGRGGGGRAGDGPVTGGAQGPELIVRWQNAQPVVDAMKMQLPPDLADHYSISVTGLPQQMLLAVLSGRGGAGRAGGSRGGTGAVNDATTPPEDPAARQKAMMDRLLSSATLSAKGRDPQTADLARQTGDKQSLIFGFVKSSLPLTAADKDVLFTLKMGPLSLKAKFEPKDMTYKGELAL